MALVPRQISPRPGEAVSTVVVDTEGLKPIEPAFDAIAYMGDLLQAGIRTVTNQGKVIIYAPPGQGFGKAYRDVQRRWEGAIRACPEYLDIVAAFAPTRVCPSSQR